jgi:hypothetical protein
MVGYIKTVWKDRIVQYPNRYKDQNNIVYTFTRDSGTVTEAGTSIIASNMNKIESQLERTDLLDSDSIEGTTQYPTKTGSDITKIEHKETSNLTNIVRTDTFAYTRSSGIITQIIETRTLSSTFGSISKTLTYNFDASGNYLNTVVN